MLKLVVPTYHIAQASKNTAFPFIFPPSLRSSCQYPSGQSTKRQRLYEHGSGSGQSSIKKPLSPEYRVFNPANKFNIVVYFPGESYNTTGINFQSLPRLQLLLSHG